MSIKVTEAMLDAAYKWAEKQSSMVDFMSEDEVKQLLTDAFLLMYNTGYPDCTPVKNASTASHGSATIT
jgi:hypothetical protein